MEYCVTISPDPKAKIVKKTYGAMSPLKQYQHLAFTIRRTCNGLRKQFIDWKFVFEISGSGNIHAHGSIFVNDTSDNLHMLHVKTFQTRICGEYAPRAKTQFMLDVCCKIKKRDDGIISDSYRTWEDYLNKHQANIPKWMSPIGKTQEVNIFLEDMADEREKYVKEYSHIVDINALDNLIFED